MAEEKNKVGAPEGNKNASKWTIESAKELFNKAIELSNIKNDKTYEYDFIGEIARELNQYKEIFSYLKKSFPELSDVHKQLMTNMEANCFYNLKRGNIREATGIMNLKANHKWTDRIDNTSGDKPLKRSTTVIEFKKSGK